MNFNCSIDDLIDQWDAPKDSLEICELFGLLRTATAAHLSDEPLNAKGIIRIVRDLRDLVNPKKDEDIYFFTDRICDRILLKHEGIDSSELPALLYYITNCEKQACLKH